MQTIQIYIRELQRGYRVQDARFIAMRFVSVEGVKLDVTLFVQSALLCPRCNKT